jgi:ribosome-binding protein aMBF1 (putative translation factor)
MGRFTADATTLVEDVDKRLVMMTARKKLGESQQALAISCAADAVALAISLTLFK